MRMLLMSTCLLIVLPMSAFAQGEECVSDADCPEDEVCVTPDWHAGEPIPTGTCEGEDEGDVSFDEAWLGLSCAVDSDCPLGFECEEVSVGCDEPSDVWVRPHCSCPSCDFVPACPPCVCPFDDEDPLACGEAPWKLCVFHLTDCEKDQDCTEGLVCHQQVDCEEGGLRCTGGGYGKCPECGCPGGDITGEACRACDCWTSFDLVCEDVPRTGCEVVATGCMPPDIECDAADDCPAGWACLLFPEEGTGYCHPPGWEYMPMRRTGGSGSDGGGGSDSSAGSGEMLVNTASPQTDGGGRKGCSASPVSLGTHEILLLLAGLGLIWIAKRRRRLEPRQERT